MTILLAAVSAAAVAAALQYSAEPRKISSDVHDLAAEEVDPVLASLAGRVRSRLLERQVRISAELAQLEGHPWAGQYGSENVAYDALSIRLAPEAGVIALGFSCVGTFVHGEGDIGIDPDGALRMDFRQFGQSGLPTELPLRWWPVSWGERRYLIADEWMDGFIQEICEGTAATQLGHWSNLVSADTKNRSVAGRPRLPAPYADRLPLSFLPNGRVQLGVTCPEGS